MRELELEVVVPLKGSDHVLPLFNTKHSGGQSLALFQVTVVTCGKEHPVERLETWKLARSSCNLLNHIQSVQSSCVR